MFNGHRVSVWDSEEVLETDGGESCRTVRVYLMSQNCLLKNG